MEFSGRELHIIVRALETQAEQDHKSARKTQEAAQPGHARMADAFRMQARQVEELRARIETETGI